MPQNYSDELLSEIARIAHGQGLNYGEYLKKALESGSLTPGQKVNLVIPIGNIKPENLSLLTRATLAFGTPTAGVVSNSVIVGMGVYTSSSSALQYHLTQDRKAKALYALSAAFSTSAIVSGGLAIASRTCQISGTAAISEACGLAFLRLGNKAHVTALQLEGKPVPLNLQKFIDPNLRPSSFPATGLSWVMPQSIPSTVIDFIPFEKIGHLVGFSITIYGYTRLSIFFYRYGKLVLRKFQSKRRSKLIKQQAVFLIVQIKRIISKRRLKSQQHILFCT